MSAAADAVESVLDEVRGGALALDAELVAPLLSCRVHPGRPAAGDAAPPGPAKPSAAQAAARRWHISLRS